MRNFGSMSHNGKSICEGRAKFNRKVQFRPNEANCFFRLLNYKKIQYEKQVATKCIGFFYYIFNPAFCKYYVELNLR